MVVNIMKKWRKKQKVIKTFCLLFYLLDECRIVIVAEKIRVKNDFFKLKILFVKVFAKSVNINYIRNAI